MKFFAAENLTSLSVVETVPWEFKATALITEQVRRSKEDRQDWYQTDGLKHNFYTGLGTLNPNQRASKQNPVHCIHAFVADYDIAIANERVDEAVIAMPIKPTWAERSLGGNLRLIWILERPLYVGTNEFCRHVLQEAIKWLKLDLLPALDDKAFVDPTRLYCNGC